MPADLRPVKIASATALVIAGAFMWGWWHPTPNGVGASLGAVLAMGGLFHLVTEWYAIGWGRGLATLLRTVYGVGAPERPRPPRPQP